MTHREGFPRFSARSAWRGDAGHRKPRAPSQSHGPRLKAMGRPKALGSDLYGSLSALLGINHRTGTATIFTR